MTPKDLAVTIWSMARLDYPASEELQRRLRYAIKSVLDEISEDPFLVESENDPNEQALLDNIDSVGNQFYEEKDKKNQESESVELDGNEDNEVPEKTAVITPQTLSMYYYGFAKLTKKDKTRQGKIF